MSRVKILSITVLALLATAIFFLSGACLGFGIARFRAEPMRHFYGDEITIYGRDDAGNDLYLDLSLSRKQGPLSGAFEHYYNISLLYRDTNLESYSQEKRKGETVTPLGALTEFTHQRFPDLSARESLSFTVSLGGRVVRIEYPNLESEFLIKNSIQYTKYMSVGRAKVTIDGASFAAEGISMTSYSHDYKPYIFFAGYDTLRSDTHVFGLWDEEHNFYFLDTSSVPNPIPAYMPHTWVLAKESLSGASRKAFAASVSSRQEQGESSSWQIELPDIHHAHIELTVKSRKSGTPNEGIVVGTLEDDRGMTRAVRGVFAHHMYGDWSTK